MDFFRAQDNARRNTWRLAGLFAAAVVSLVVLTNLLLGFVYLYSARPGVTGGLDLNATLADVPPGYWLMISLGVIGVIALASGYKYLQVRGGGRTIAESLGGRLIPAATDDPRQRRLLNVVEEMAIASGIPVPPVYLIDEPSINAFAAGFGVDDAVIGINQGTLDHLDRDELQGVVAHEFSHLLNGDSRLNLRLIAILHGILFIGLLGRILLRGFGRRGGRRGNSAGAPGLVLGLGLLVIGYAGTFFGNMIKAAVSRQREFLADAASVQYTRNPGGIAGALKKIGGLSFGSTMTSAAAGEASHLFFGQAGRVFLGGLMATHPPLDKRIRAVDPRWDGTFPVVAAAVHADAAGASVAAGASDAAGSGAAAGFAGLTATGAAAESALEIHDSPDQVVAAVGRLDDSGLARAATLIDGLPAALRSAAHDPFGSRALTYALVLDPGEPGQTQLAYLATRAEPGVADELGGLVALVQPLDEQQKLTLLELSLPALKQLSTRQYRTFIDNLIDLMKADRRIDLLEWVLHRLLVKELRPHFEGRPRHRARHGDIAAVRAEAAELLSALAREAERPEAQDGPEAERAFTAGWQALGLPEGHGGALNLAEDPNFARLNRALAELRALKPLQKPRLVKACAAAVLANGPPSLRQSVLLQGVAATLDCPLPPSISGR
ncbi:MAG: M48 family metallopeptidase [Pseudomonadales bacterium]